MNTQSQGPVALKNVAAFMAMTQRLIDRPSHLSGFGCFHGPSGFGKTWASIFAQNRTNAVRVEVGDSWSRRTFLRNILHEFGDTFRNSASVSDLAEGAIAAMGENPRRPLIVDEADKLVDKGMIELVRELQESSGAPVILIGEEKLPTKLLTVERMHNRVLDWFPAQPCDLEDAQELSKAFARGITIKDDLLDKIRAQSGGRARRIVNNIDHATVVARNRGVKTLNLEVWGSEPFFTGEPPQARAVEMYTRKKVA